MENVNIVLRFYNSYIFIYRYIIKVMTKEEKLTSVKITQPLFDKFKMACLEDNFSFKKLADRAIYLYLTDKDFKQQVHKINNVKLK